MWKLELDVDKMFHVKQSSTEFCACQFIAVARQWWLCEKKVLGAGVLNEPALGGPH